jgi:peptidoglycan/LPS O-acetylase OafA/YrhL
MAAHPARTPTLGLNSVAFLDLLRAFAANIVLLGHAGLIFNLRLRLNFGTIGVSIFFVLSGFLITQSSLARLQRTGPYFAPYLTDRFARIFTAYVPALIIVAIINAVLPLGSWGQEGNAQGPAAFVGNLLLLQDYPLFQAARRLLGPGFYIRPYNTAEPFWTIPIEFWIYVVFGLAVFSLVMRERLPGFVTAACLIVALPVVIWNAAAGGGNGLSIVWLVGAAASYLWVKSWSGSAHRLHIGLVVAAVGAASLVGRGLKTNWNFQDIGLVITGTTVLLGLLSVAEALPPAPPPLRRLCTFLASYSYSLYLIHNTVLVIARQTWSAALGPATVPLACAACHAAAFLMYLAFERHYRHVGAYVKRHLPLLQPSMAA